MHDLHLRDAHEVVSLLRTGQVTPEELIDAVQERIEATDGEVHATPITCFDRAREAARRLRPPAQPPSGYLYGLPVLIKDTQAVAGVRWTQGSPVFSERVAKASEALVLQLEARGAIIVGKTNTPEFAAGSQTFNPIFPTTVSPWDTRTTAGGSSGGAAAALASCQCWLATGSDLGGSLRTPAAFCGVVGFRVSPGRTPRDAGPSGPYEALHSINGPMARCVRDVGLFLDAMEGSHGWDFSMPALLVGETWEGATLRGAGEGCGEAWRVAFSGLGCGIAPEVEGLSRKAAATLAGCGVRELQACDLDVGRAERAFMVLRGSAFSQSPVFKKVLGDAASASLVKPEIHWNVAVGNAPQVQQMVKLAYDDLSVVATQVKALFESVDILVTPATLGAAFDAEVRYPSSQVGRSFANYLDWMMPACIGTAMLCPALVMPCGFLEDGRPVGVQLLGAPGSDAKVLAAAAALEVALALPRACPVPRRGDAPLDTQGPRTAAEAERHHEGAVDLFVKKYGTPSARL